MKTLKLDMEEVANALVGERPDTLKTYSIRGLNWNDILLLIETNGGIYAWKDVGRVYRAPDEFFESAKEALFWALKEGHEIFQFESFADFCAWHLQDRHNKKWEVKPL